MDRVRLGRRQGGDPSACEERGHGHGVQPRRGWAVSSRRGSTRRWWRRRGRVSQGFLPSRSGRCPVQRWGRGSGRPRRGPPLAAWPGGVISPRRDMAPITALVRSVRSWARSPAIPVCADGSAGYVTAFGSDGWAGGLQHVEGAGPAPPVRQGGVGRPSPAGTHGTPGGAAPPGRTRPPPPGPGSGRASLPSAPRGDRTSTSSRKGPRRPVSPQS